MKSPPRYFQSQSQPGSLYVISRVRIDRTLRCTPKYASASLEPIHLHPTAVKLLTHVATEVKKALNRIGGSRNLKKVGEHTLGDESSHFTPVNTAVCGWSHSR